MSLLVVQYGIATYTMETMRGRDGFGGVVRSALCGVECPGFESRW